MQLRSESSIIGWWLQGLGLLIPAWLKNLFNPAKKRILFQLQDDQLAIIWPGQKKSKPEPEFYNLHQADQRKKLLKKLNRYSKDQHNLVLCIPANKGLRNILRLPVNAESDLASILGFEIDRQTPFTPDQVYSGYRLISKNKSTNTLSVELNVIPQKIVNPLLSELAKAGIKPHVVELLDDQPESGINVLAGSVTDGVHRGSIRINQLLSLLAFVLLGIAIAIPFINLKSAIKQTELAIKDARSGALEVNELHVKWEKLQQKQELINKKIQEHRSITRFLDELTRLIPDDTWLTRLQIRGNTIRLQGESSSATALISIIEKSENFSGTRFQSPVTTNISTGKDRFQITTQIIFQESSK